MPPKQSASKAAPNTRPRIILRLRERDEKSAAAAATRPTSASKRRTEILDESGASLQAIYDQLQKIMNTITLHESMERKFDGNPQLLRPIRELLGVVMEHIEENVERPPSEATTSNTFTGSMNLPLGGRMPRTPLPPPLRRRSSTQEWSRTWNEIQAIDELMEEGQLLHESLERSLPPRSQLRRRR